MSDEFVSRDFADALKPADEMVADQTDLDEERARSGGLSSRFVVAGAIGGAVAGFAIELIDLGVGSSWDPDGWGIDVLEGLVLAFTTGVVFTLAGVGVMLASRRVRIPWSAPARGALVGLMLAVFGLVVGLLVAAVRPGLWHEWPVVLVPALVGGVAAGVLVWWERRAR